VRSRQQGARFRAVLDGLIVTHFDSLDSLHTPRRDERDGDAAERRPPSVGSAAVTAGERTARAVLRLQASARRMSARRMSAARSDARPAAARRFSRCVVESAGRREESGRHRRQMLEQKQAMNEQTSKRLPERPNKQTSGRTDERTDEQTNGRTDGRTDEQPIV